MKKGVSKVLKVLALFTTASTFPLGVGAAPLDTLSVSDKYITHLIFSTDVGYAHLSNQTDITGDKIDAAKNKVSLIALRPFKGTASLSVEEANGQFHTYIIRYERDPGLLIYDKRGDAVPGTFAKLDTLYLSQAYTTHVIFATDINYAALSNTSDISASVVEQGKNKLAIKARAPFSGCASISAEEANGVFHTYYLCFKADPDNLVLDTRIRRTEPSDSAATARGKAQFANYLKKGDAPLLSDIIKLPQKLYHLSRKQYNVRFTVENIFSYSDITYITIAMDNESQISYESSDATFVIESKRNSKRKVFYETNIYPKNRFGTLTAKPFDKARMVYSFDKMTLSSEQVLKIYLYEKDGQRNTELTLSFQDINTAVSPYKD